MRCAWFFQCPRRRGALGKYETILRWAALNEKAVGAVVGKLVRALGTENPRRQCPTHIVRFALLICRASPDGAGEAVVQTHAAAPLSYCHTSVKMALPDIRQILRPGKPCRERTMLSRDCLSSLYVLSPSGG